MFNLPPPRHISTLPESKRKEAEAHQFGKLVNPFPRARRYCLRPALGNFEQRDVGHEQIIVGLSTHSICSEEKGPKCDPLRFTLRAK